jgi:hypothetical protein
MVWKASFFALVRHSAFRDGRNLVIKKGPFSPFFLLFLAGAGWTFCFRLVFLLLCPCGITWNGLSAVVVGVVVGFVTRVYWLFHGSLAFAQV